ncbi:MAG: cation diffusion facilitator family transporter [Actinomycetota bacterium]
MAHDHAHHPGHQHGAGSSLPLSRLMGAAGVNAGFAVVQITVGLAIGSVVVLADAAHQVVDAIGLLTALVAAVLARRPVSAAMSFGWGKVDALGAFVSGLLLLGSIVWIGYEAIRRLFSPTEVEGGAVILIGLLAIAVNGGSVLALSGGGRRQHLAVRAARLHLLVDLAGSFVVVLAGVALVGTSWLWIDPLASLVLSAVVLRSTLRLLRAAAHELLDRAPAALDVGVVSATLARQPGVERVHHVHVRSLGQQRTSVTAHVVVEGAQTVHEAQQRTMALNHVLEHDLGVDHATIQLECHPCDDADC